MLYSETSFLKERKPFLKNWGTVFQLKVMLLKVPYFPTKLPCQKPVLRKIEWGVKNRPIMNNAVLPLTTYFLKIQF